MVFRLGGITVVPVRLPLCGLCSDLPRLAPAPGISSVYFEGLPYEGKPTRVFAWIGVPGISRKEMVPGIVLVHGGGGTAYHDWVKLWVERGYAALAIDTTRTTRWMRELLLSPCTVRP